MSNTISLVNPEKAQQQICVVLEQLTRDYQSFQTEISIINREFAISSEAFSVSEEIELLTTDLCGYGNQIKYQKHIQNPKQASKFLRQIHIFAIQSIANLYFSQSSYFPHTKQYLQKLDYLKFLLIDWLEHDEAIATLEP